MKALLRVLLAACAAVGALAQNAPSIRISADHDEIYLGESVILRVEVRDSQTRHPQPELGIPPETATVHALGQQTSSSSYISLVNGRRECVESHATIHTYRLVPRKAGRLNIPPIVIGSKDSTITSQPFAILVRKPDDQDEVKIRLYAIPPDPFPDEPFTVRLEIDIVPRPGQPELDPLSPENLPGNQLPLLIVPYLEDDFRPDSLIQPPRNPFLSKLAKAAAPNRAAFSINDYTTSDNPFIYASQTRIPFALPVHQTNGIWRYQLDYPCQAIRSGTYDFGPVIFKGNLPTNTPSSGPAPTARIYAATPALRVTVTFPARTNQPPNFIGAVGRNMRAQATLDTYRTHLGEPVLLTIELRGKIRPDHIQTPILHQENEAFSLDPEPVKTETLQDGRRFHYRLRPLRQGTLELPTYSFSYWDSDSRTYQTIATTPLPIQVLPPLPEPFGDTPIIETPPQPAGLQLGPLPPPPQPLLTSRFLQLLLAGPALCLLALILKMLAKRLPEWLQRRQNKAIERRARKHLRTPSAATLPALRAWLGNALTPAELARELHKRGIEIPASELERLESHTPFPTDDRRDR